ncbi:8206_t:CDS:2, partial [Paraglomus occultum]
MLLILLSLLLSLTARKQPFSMLFLYSWEHGISAYKVKPVGKCLFLGLSSLGGTQLFSLWRSQLVNATWKLTVELEKTIIWEKYE